MSVGQGIKLDLEAEVAAYVEHINNLLKSEADLNGRYLPLSGAPADLFGKCRDGVLLSRTVNAIKPNTVDLKKLSTNINLAEIENGAAPGSSAIFQVQANQNAFIEGAAKLGIKLVNIGAQDIIDGKDDLVLGVVWQIVRFHLLQGIDVDRHPELIRLMEKGESLSALINIGPENILMRWINYHLRRANANKKVVNFGESLKDSTAYLHLLPQIAPKLVDRAKVDAALALTDSEARARAVLEIAETLGCRKFVTAKDIVSGNNRLNLAFTATLFNAYVGIQLPSEEEIAALYNQLDAMKSEIAELSARVAASQQDAQERSAEASSMINALTAETNSLSAKIEQQRDVLASTEESLTISQQQNSTFAQQIARLETELQQNKADLIKSGEEKVISMQQRYDATVADLNKTIEALRAEVLALSLERNGLKKDKESLEEKVRRQKEMNDLMAGKVYVIAEELNHNKKKDKEDKKK